MLKNRLKITVFGILSLGLMVSVSCKKKKDTLAKITVYDDTNSVVADCRVVLKGTSTTNQQSDVNLYDTAYTNGSGEAIFNFNDVYQLGQAGVAVLNIEAQKNGLKGTGIIKIEEEKTKEERVYIKQ